MFVYKAINIINGHIYIGQTRQTLKRRIICHKNLSKTSNFKFYKAIRKYGLNNFKWEIIEYCNNQQELNQSEIYWIYRFNSYKRGYNSTIGGNYTKPHSAETRKKISDKVKEAIMAGKMKKSGCYLSANEIKARMIPFEEIEKLYKSKNYIIGYSEDEYYKGKRKLPYICDKQHNIIAYPLAIKTGKGICPVCEKIQKRTKYEHLNKIFEKNNYKLLTTKQEYEANTRLKKVIGKCPKNHICNINIMHFKKRNRSCKECFKIDIKQRVFTDATKLKLKKAKEDKTKIYGWVDINKHDIKIIKKMFNENKILHHIYLALNKKYSRFVIANRIKMIQQGLL